MPTPDDTSRGGRITRRRSRGTPVKVTSPSSGKSPNQKKPGNAAAFVDVGLDAPAVPGGEATAGGNPAAGEAITLGIPEPGGKAAAGDGKGARFGAALGDPLDANVVKAGIGPIPVSAVADADNPIRKVAAVVSVTGRSEIPVGRPAAHRLTNAVSGTDHVPSIVCVTGTRTVQSSPGADTLVSEPSLVSGCTKAHATIAAPVPSDESSTLGGCSVSDAGPSVAALIPDTSSCTNARADSSPPVAAT
jgi:hypothetical protein